MSIEESQVQASLEEMREAQLVRRILPDSGRSVLRYRHVIDETLGLSPGARAIFALLLLRGPQTVGELRARSQRMVSFRSGEEMSAAVEELEKHETPLIGELRRPGQKELRLSVLVATLPSGWEPFAEKAHEENRVSPSLEDALNEIRQELSNLQNDVRVLSSDVATLRAQLGG